LQLLVVSVIHLSHTRPSRREGISRGGAYESTSELLARRRRQMYMEELQKAGFVLPKRVLNHSV
jgi:hypothetical protein